MYFYSLRFCLFSIYESYFIYSFLPSDDIILTDYDSNVAAEMKGSFDGTTNDVLNFYRLKISNGPHIWGPEERVIGCHGNKMKDDRARSDFVV